MHSKRKERPSGIWIVSRVCRSCSLEREIWGWSWWVEVYRVYACVFVFRVSEVREGGYGLMEGRMHVMDMGKEVINDK